MLDVVLSNQFKKDLKLASKRGYDLNLLNNVVEKLANEEVLDAKYKEHELSGNYKGFKECHIQPDWLVIYRSENDILVLTLTRTGTHSELFKK